MIKKIFAVLFFVGSVCLVFAQQQPQVALIDATGDLQAEKAVFIKTYSYLYKDIVKDLEITDLTKDLTKRFNDEINMIKEDKRTGISVRDGEKTVAFISLEQLDKKEQMRLRRCAIDPECRMDLVAKALISFVFKKFSDVSSVVTVILKKSNTEKQFLAKFGFKECELVSNAYDAERYTSYKLVK